MPTCIVFKCASSSRNNKDLKFHHIPFDPERCKQWVTACKRIDLINRSPKLLKNKFVCSLHFDKSMYKNQNLKQSATPTLNLICSIQDSFTQTWESIKFIEPSEPVLVKTESPDLTKIEVTTSYTQTEEFIFNANCDVHNMQRNKIEIKTEHKRKEDDTEKTDKMELSSCISISSDSTQETADETSEMSIIDEFLQLNEEIEAQIKQELKKKKNIPQTPIQNITKSRLRSKDKGVQTGDVTVYDIPKNNQCFQQCIRCGKNANRLKPLLKPDQRITLEEFETACERFLSPTFCATVKTEIKLNKLLIKYADNKNKCSTKKKMMPTCERLLSPTLCATVNTENKLNKILNKNTENKNKRTTKKKMIPIILKNGSVNMALLSNNN